jgi:two-component system, NtrC family, sensor histidine kinase HydH
MKSRTRSWSAWVFGGSLAMAALAVLALGSTVHVAQRALGEASDVIVRGEGDALVSAIAADLAEEEPPLAPELLARELAALDAKGLRYLALVDRDGHAHVEAGTARMSDAILRPGESRALDKRVRVAGMLMPPRRWQPGPPPPVPSARVPGQRFDRAAPPLLVIEFEPPVVEKLRADLTRISVVAAIAGSVLLAFAIAWSRSANRLAAVEQRAAREQRLVALGSMSSVMAHELRNPLASLKGHAQLLVEDIADDKQRARAERVVSEAERLELLTTSLLDFVRDGPIELTSVTPAELVAQSLEDLPKERVDVELSRAPSSLRIDGMRLARAVHNLVDNALQATPEGRRVELRIEHEGTETRLSVRDGGPGLPPGFETQIFEPFITTRVRGTGLGLAVARRIAEQHGGTLMGENHPSGGALFELRIPDVHAQTSET